MLSTSVVVTQIRSTLCSELVSCTITTLALSCQMHDNDSITEQFAMNVIAWAYKQGHLMIFQICCCILPDLTWTGVTADQQAITMRNQESLSVFSDE